MSDAWVEISCEVPTELSDVLASFLTTLSGSGVCVENLQVDTFSVSDIPVSTRVTIKAYLPSEPDPAPKMTELETYLQELSALQPYMRIGAPAMKAVRSEEWSTSWKVHFKPLRVGRRLLIVPTWEEVAPLPGDLLLRIDPGMAFGTGGHETTRLCLEMLEKTMDSSGNPTPSLLDLGTGSGILAMAAALLGADPVLALDIDADAVEIARENLAINGLTGKVVCAATPVESVMERFDIILANILAEELVRLAPQLADRLNPGGVLILSGILAEKEVLVRLGFDPSQFAFVETARQGEWVAMLYRRQTEK